MICNELFIYLIKIKYVNFHTYLKWIDKYDGVIPISKLCVSVKSQPHKQRIWFLPTLKPTLKKPKELFFANARTENETETVNLETE